MPGGRPPAGAEHSLTPVTHQSFQMPDREGKFGQHWVLSSGSLGTCPSLGLLTQVVGKSHPRHGLQEGLGKAVQPGCSALAQREGHEE